MAKVKKNVVIRGLQGKIGGLVFREMPDGSTRVSAAPDFSKRKFSEAQITHQARIREASAYAKDASKREPIYAEIAAGTVCSPYNIALSDWFHSPVIHDIERKGAVIRVDVSDNVMVAKVQVTILGEAGKILEKGDAVKVDPSTSSGANWWEYVSAHDGKVIAEAWDLARNCTRREL